MPTWIFFTAKIVISDYFLGHDEVVEQALGMEEQN